MYVHVYGMYMHEQDFVDYENRNQNSLLMT